MCGWQVKLCDPLVTRGPYLSASAVVLPIIRRCTNNQIILALVSDHQLSGVVYNFGRVCQYLCLSVCETITFESLDVGS